MGNNNGTPGKVRQARRKKRKDPDHLASVISDSEAEARRLEGSLLSVANDEQLKIRARIDVLRKSVIPNYERRLEIKLNQEVPSNLIRLAALNAM